MEVKLIKGVDLDTILSASSIEALGPATWLRIRDSGISLPELFKYNRLQLEKIGLADYQVQAVIDRPRDMTAVKRLLKSKNITLITLENKKYPPLLKEIIDPPLWLFYRGDISVLSQNCLTVVGTRRPNGYALTALKNILIPELARQLCLVSGLAYGIDKRVHQISLESGGKTAAVLAGGLDSIYPIEHYRLADTIIESGGVVVSEYPPLVRPKPYKFPVRNRIISGLSKASVIVQAKLKSGTLTTAKSALDYNRDIFAIPSPITDTNGEGANFLIKNGATLLDSPRQLFEYFNLKTDKKNIKVDKELQKILDLITDNPLSVDQMADLFKKPVEEILGCVTQLELEGLIYQNETGYYQRNKK